ncbi:unnamed protein product [Echinostoma caproni]|uniref:Amino_oxidase domain-containing protein n=1 Tax=Echinostoma caproni TaxID=27848 RepID=A0A183AUW4_9TREM|nr:unnamed protein product [Echinostoma caproni]
MFHIGMISAASVVPALLYIKDGNELVPANLIKQALESNPTGAPKEFVHAQVQSIAPVPKRNRYELEYLAHGQKRSKREEFDYVILAAPLHQEATIEGKSTLALPKYAYQRVDHSFFLGVLKDAAIGLKSNSYIPKQEVAILPTKRAYLEDPECLFRSFISPPERDLPSDRVWLAFSEPHRVPDPIRALSEKYLQLAPITESLSGPPEKNALVTKWLAYPTYKPVSQRVATFRMMQIAYISSASGHLSGVFVLQEDPVKELGQFVLAPRLYYANAIEQAASCMEMAAIGGRNVALLVAADRQKAKKTSGQEAAGDDKPILVDHFSIPKLSKL